MDQDLVLKTILILSISMSILILTYFSVRLLISLKKLIEETTRVVENTTNITDTVATGIRSVKSGFEASSMVLSLFNVANTAGIVNSVKDFINNKIKKSSKKKDKVKEDKEKA